MSDPDGQLLDELQIRHLSAHEGKDIAYPTQVLVDEHGRIAWIYVSHSARTRADPRSVLRAIDALGATGDA